VEGKLKNYRQSEVVGKSQLELILQVYDGAIHAFTEAGNCCEREETEAAAKCMEQARRCVTHLYTTLDFEHGGEVADNLGKLYTFIITQTDLAQATKDIVCINDNVKILRTMRAGWSELNIQQTVTAKPSPRAAVIEAVGPFSTSA